MSLATLQTSVWKLLQEDSPSAADNAILLAAFNQIRLEAELKMDWVASESVGYLTVAASTGGLLSATKASYSSEAPSGDSLSVKQVRWIRTRETTTNSSGYTWMPGQLMNRSTYEALLVRQDRTDASMWSRESGSVEFNEASLPETRNLILRDGLTLYSLRDASVNVQLWCYAFLPAYEDFDADDDFLITYGANYMMWEAVVYLNKNKGVFIPRNEGSLTEDSAILMRDRAWEALQLWDMGLKNNQDFITA